MIFLGLMVAIVVVALAAGLGIALGGGGGSSDSELSIGGCVAQTFPDQGRKHATQLPKGYKYNSFPPTSGTHNPTPAIWNIYDEPVKQMLLVHNLEHGGIVVQYGDQVPAVTATRYERGTSRMRTPRSWRRCPRSRTRSRSPPGLI